MVFSNRLYSSSVSGKVGGSLGLIAESCGIRLIHCACQQYRRKPLRRVWTFCRVLEDGYDLFHSPRNSVKSSSLISCGKNLDRSAMNCCKRASSRSYFLTTSALTP